MSDEVTFGNWLRQRRSEIGVTREELSDNLGFSLAMLRKIESGERKPSGQIAALLAEYFRVPADEREAFIMFARAEPAAKDSRDDVASDQPSRTPWRSTFLRKTNLPSALTPLIGREQEVQEGCKALLKSDARLLTLTGAPGIGKTRLAVQVATKSLEHFEDGAFFVDLSAVVDPDMVLPEVAHLFDLKDQMGSPASDTLLEYVREKRLLLVLDNFEQVLDAAPAVVRLLEASPWTKVLATSREALHVRGERKLVVGPLGLPGAASSGRVGAGVSPAVALFVERARAADPSFVLDPSNSADIEAICIRLDGLPLAIELAAARVEHFSTGVVRSELSNTLALLTNGPRDLPTRHKTLRSAIEWSYNLLEAEERRIFRYLGVFWGGFTSEAAGQVCGNSITGSFEDVLISLANKHLINTGGRAYSPGEDAQEPRFAMLESIREYALEQLQVRDELSDAQRAHARYFSRVASQAEQHFNGAKDHDWGVEGARWINKLERELDNIRAALTYYASGAGNSWNRSTGKEVRLEDILQGLELAAALRRVWFVRGHLTEGIRWLDLFLGLVPEDMEAQPVEMRQAYISALIVRGRLGIVQGGSDWWVPKLERALVVTRDLDDKSLLALGLLTLGGWALAQNKLDQAAVYQKQCLTLYREIGSNWGIGAVLEDIGNLELSRGNLGAAQRALEESLAHYKAVGEGFGSGAALDSLGRAAYYGRDYPKAEAYWREGLRLRREFGDKSRVAQSLGLLGWAALRQGRYSEAGELLSDGLRAASDIGLHPVIHWCLFGLGMLEASENHITSAAYLMSAAARLSARLKLVLPEPAKAEIDAETALTRSRAEGDQWDQAWEKGQAASLEQVVTTTLQRDAGQRNSQR